MSKPQKIEIGFCKDCKWRNSYSECCNLQKVHQGLHGITDSKDYIDYEYYEGGVFYVADLFGCVHWKGKDE